ncbi:MAG: pilus assembly protein TadG-related protein, partial [Pararhodobacter sp.]
VFVAMILFSGVAVDMMRYENERLRMQNTADRAVLAATMLRANPANPSPEQILRAYFAAEGLTDQLGENFTVDQNDEDGRVVTVFPAASVPSLFMSFVGVDDLDLVTPSQATEMIHGGPDLELVMVLDVSGSMGQNNRIGAMRDAATNLTTELLGVAEEPGKVAITLVPYDTWVVPPAGFLNHFSNVTGSGACNDWSNWTQITDSLSLPTTRTSCNTASWRTVRPYVNDPAQAASHIGALVAANTTSIDLGVRYGALFFDPSIRPAISQMVANGDIHPAFEGRPYDWDERGVVRALILLTDGENCCGARYSTMIQDSNTVAVCDRLKEQGVLIYAIAYLAPPRGVSLMQNCASSPSHYFNTTADQIIDVFRGISTSIQTQALRLTL